MNRDFWFIVAENYKAEKIDKNGNRVKHIMACWYTNLDIDKRHEELVLTNFYEGNEEKYPFFDNYNAINIDNVKDIPMDFTGVMGVPITFLDKYSPDQFEIIKFRKGDDNKDLSINGKNPYFRILIKNKRAVSKEEMLS